MAMPPVASVAQPQSAVTSGVPSMAIPKTTEVTGHTKKNRSRKLRCFVPSDSMCESRKPYRLNFCINSKHQFTMQRIRQEQARIGRSPRNQFQNLGASLPLETGPL